MKVNNYHIDMKTGHIILCDNNNKEYDVNDAFDTLKNIFTPVLVGWRNVEDYFLVGYEVSSSNVKEIDIRRNDAGKISSVSFILTNSVDFKLEDYFDNESLKTVLSSVLGINTDSVDYKCDWGRVFCDIELEPSKQKCCVKDLLFVCHSVEIRYN